MSEARPIGTWFYTEGGGDFYHLWQETERGPKRIGVLFNHPSIDFIVERLNSAQRADQ